MSPHSHPPYSPEWIHPLRHLQNSRTSTHPRADPGLVTVVVKSLELLFHNPALEARIDLRQSSKLMSAVDIDRSCICAKKTVSATAGIKGEGDCYFEIKFRERAQVDNVLYVPEY
ncbi:hypothetical protein Tco_0191100 [Tanacetum coccineum]